MDAGHILAMNELTKKKAWMAIFDAATMRDNLAKTLPESEAEKVRQSR